MFHEAVHVQIGDNGLITPPCGVPCLLFLPPSCARSVVITLLNRRLEPKLGQQPGGIPRLHFRGLLGLHTAVGLLDSPRQPCKASVQPVTRQAVCQLPDQTDDYLGGTLLRLVIRAVGAH
jgi:hypothetical protein